MTVRRGQHAAVLGHPISHSLSPVLHRAAYKSLALDWTYDAIDITEATLAEFLLSRDSAWAGLSLTMPLKQAVIPHLATMSETARITGAVNTVVFEWSGLGSGTAGPDVLPGGLRPVLRGDNTDVVGIVRAVEEVADWRGLSSAPHMTSLADRTAVVVGGGATAASALVALRDLGFGTVAVAVRNPVRAESLHAVADALGLSLSIVPLTDWPTLWPTAALVISTLPGGAADSLAQAIEFGRAGASSLGPLLDVAYAQRPTALGRVWQANGGVYISGERMLLHQAVEQVRLVTGSCPDITQMDAALQRALSQ